MTRRQDSRAESRREQTRDVPAKEAPSAFEIADRLHSSAIHLLRRLRVEDAATGLNAPRLSALSVIVFGGPITVTDLAAAEQVRPPTISRLVSDLEADGLVNRTRDPSDGRIQWISATARGRRVLEKGRRARVRKLEEDVGRLDPGERAAIEQALSILEGLALPSDHPGHGGSEG